MFVKDDVDAVGEAEFRAVGGDEFDALEVVGGSERAGGGEDRGVVDGVDLGGAAAGGEGGEVLLREWVSVDNLAPPPPPDLGMVSTIVLTIWLTANVLNVRSALGCRPKISGESWPGNEDTNLR